MTESEFDELLRRALLQAVREDFAEVLQDETPDEEQEFSPGYLRRRSKLLAHPFSYARRKLRPAWQKTLRAAACLVLAVGIAAGALAMVSPEAFARVQRVIVEWFETHTDFRFTGDVEADIGEWRPTYLPEGLWDESVEKQNNTTAIEYTSQNNEFISFYYAPQERGGALSANNEELKYIPIMINGCSAFVFKSTDASKATIIVWNDKTSQVSFRIFSRIDCDELIQVAESIVQTK